MAELIVNPSPADIDWTGATSYLFFNPRSPAEHLKAFESLKPQLAAYDSHFWLFTSGSESFPKCVGLSKQAVLSNAKAVSDKFGFKHGETWLACLPSFHVGGLSIWARAFLSQQQVVESEWELGKIKAVFESRKIEWTSFVPTQVYDLVKANMKAPDHLRGVFVGGGALSSDLYMKATALGWPLLTTYGMTESSSQIATSEVGSDELRVLDGHNVTVDSDGRLGVGGVSVTDVIAYYDQSEWTLKDPRDNNHIYWTQDRVELKGNVLQPLGRLDDLKKTRGELVSRLSLQSRLEKLLSEEALDLKAAIFFEEDARIENRICLVVEPELWSRASRIIQKFNSSAAPFERIEALYIVLRLPSSELGKLQYGKLEALLKRADGF